MKIIVASRGSIPKMSVHQNMLYYAPNAILCDQVIDFLFYFCLIGEVRVVLLWLVGQCLFHIICIEESVTKETD